MDFSQNRWTFVTFRLYYPLCVSRRVDTWHIVYLSYKPITRIPVLKYQFIKVRLRYLNVTRAAWTAMELARIHSQLQGSSARPSHFLNFHRCPCSIQETLFNVSLYTETIGKLCAKYQLCAIHTADNTDGKSRKSIVSEKSPSFR